jgi:hypothetical protein
VQGESVDVPPASGVICSCTAEAIGSCHDERLQACWGYDPLAFYFRSSLEDPCHSIVQRYLPLTAQQLHSWQPEVCMLNHFAL